MKIVPNPHITERGISSRLNHKSFIEHARKTQRFKSAKITRAVDKANHQVLATLGLEDQPLQSMISIYPEFIAYTYNLYGFSRKLLMYIIFYELDKDTCRFLAGAQMMKRFHNFCFLFAEETEAEKNVLQAIGVLKRKNIILNTNGEEYMLNPLIAGGSSRFKRKKLIDDYSNLLAQKRLDTSADFYPKFQ